MTKGLAILGSTGTIGTNALEIVEKFPDRFRVVSLSAGRNVAKLREQVLKFRPRVVSLQDEAGRAALSGEFPEIAFGVGEDGLKDCVEADGVEVVVVGIVGFAALAPAIQAVRARRTVALANKESLVVAGSLLRKEIAASGALCIPVDSEHNAIYQLLEGRKPSDVSSLVLTASGGPLFRRPDLPLCDVTPDIAIRHPNWNMGPKISVDSATLMNKGLELIEAHFLFDLPQSKIEVWVHPQSILHGAIWLTDNTCLAQLSKPDMKSSIGFALGYPERLPRTIPKLTLQEMARLEFFEPDTQRFPALNLAREALDAGPSHLVVLNASNEVAVESFLRGTLEFSKIPEVTRRVLDNHRATRVEDLGTIFQLDRQAREAAAVAIRNR